LKELKEVLGLPALPHRIEGFDISTIQGAESVGSMVVFVDGVATPSEYRRFKIREVEGQDDYAMLAEVLRRRFARLCTSGKSDSRQSSASSSQPSLMLVDGGRGQLGAALTARAAFQDCHIPIISLAKEHEQVYVEGRAAAVDLEEYSPGLMILEAVRDEAHRFAVGYHRNLRGASVIKSVLDDVPGIGPRRKRAVLVAYGSVEALRVATAEDIACRCHIPVRTAALLLDRLKASGV
jgi:excinuclease ABC subunit C